MSAVYYANNYRNVQLIFTGSHNGEIIVWNFETNNVKHRLHENDPTCLSAGWPDDNR